MKKSQFIKINESKFMNNKLKFDKNIKNEDKKSSYYLSYGGAVYI